MKTLFGLVAFAASLAGCQMNSAANDLRGPAYAGIGEARYVGERQSAEALLGIDGFAVTCLGGRQMKYRVAQAELISGDCYEDDRMPTLERVRVLSANQQLLLVSGTGVGFTNTGAIIFHDESAQMPLNLIELGSMESFQDIVAQDRIIVRTGALEQGGCLVMYTKELTLNWALSRVERERTLSRDASGC